MTIWKIIAIIEFLILCYVIYLTWDINKQLNNWGK